MVTMILKVHLLAAYVSSHVSSCMCSSVSSVSLLLESGRGIDKLFKVFIWGLLCKHLSKVSLYLMGILGLNVLLLAVEV